MKSENLLTILLGVLVLVSAVQAYQLVNLKEDISSGTVSAASSTQSQYSSGTQSSNSQGAVTSPQSPLSALDNAPNMVGGC